MGAAAAGIAAVAGVLGALTVEEVRAQNQIQDTVDSLTVLGPSTGTTVDDLAAMRDRFQDTFNLGTAAAGDLVDAIAKLPPSVAGSADAIAQIAVQVAKLKDEDLPKAAEEAGKAAEKGGKAFLEWAQQLGFQLDPALVRAIDELEKTSGKVTSAQEGDRRALGGHQQQCRRLAARHGRRPAVSGRCLGPRHDGHRRHAAACRRQGRCPRRILSRRYNLSAPSASMPTRKRRRRPRKT